MIKTFEVNFDGLVGPTHNYAGLAFGNVASMIHARIYSNPRAAALQGLEKMKRLYALGVKQAVLPPQERPNLSLLRSLGFEGSDADIVEACFNKNLELFLACFSSSSMWTANAATVSPSTDSLDQKLHFTISNLTMHLHRAQEAPFTHTLFKKIFNHPRYFKVHPPLFSTNTLGDEGAANHCRFAKQYGEPGIQLFVYGRSGFNPEKTEFFHYPARQTLEASQSVIRLHQLNTENTLLAKQNRAAIDAGVFHNDVISVGNENVFLYHEMAFEHTEEVITLLKEKIHFPMFFIPVKTSELSFEEAVSSYLFNSQIVTLPSGDMMLVAPEECRETKSAQAVIDRILQAENPIKTVEYVDCKQSMQNGGGPACLRLRVVLNENELQYCHQGIFLEDKLIAQLEQWIYKHYRDNLTLEDMRDPLLLDESRMALDELTKLLNLGSIYSFQL